MAQSGEGWLDETRSAYLYRVIAEVERGSPHSELFRKLAHEAEGQAAIWAKNAGLASVPAFIPDLRTRLVAGLVRRYGPRAMRGILAAMKVRGLSVYGHAAPGHPAPPTASHDAPSRIPSWLSTLWRARSSASIPKTSARPGERRCPPSSRSASARSFPSRRFCSRAARVLSSPPSH